MASLHDVLDILEPEPIGEDRFLGRNLDLQWGYVFGGHFVAQALAAAQQTVREEQAAHSLHGYFLRAGDELKPVTYQVERLRDGKSFATRRVDAVQGGRTVFTLTASFQKEEAGFEHQDAMPPWPGPEGLHSQAEIARTYFDQFPKAALERLSFENAFDIRHVDPVDIAKPEAKPALCATWYRALGSLPDRPALRRALLAYISDITLVAVASRPHALSSATPGLQSTSLDHAVWFHRPVRMDDWILLVMDSPSTSGARGLARGRFFSRDGTLIASVAQEGLIRVRS